MQYYSYFGISHLIFIVSNPHNNAGVMSKATYCLPHLLLDISKELL
jgi:hypothetical protein